VTANGDDLISRAVAALPRDILATLIKPGTEFYGERADMAVRHAELAEPAGICISGAVHDAIRDQLPHMFEDIGIQNLGIGAAPVHCYAMNTESVAFSTRLAAQHPQSRPMTLRTAAVAAGVFAIVGVWGVALLAWLGANPSTAVIPATVTAGSHVPSVGITADGAALAWSWPQSAPMRRTAADTDTQTPSASQTPLANDTVADRDSQAPWASQPPLARNAAMDRSIQPMSPRPAVSEIAGIVVRGRQAPSALQTTPHNGAAALTGT
jgi:hypothetical protein